MQRENLWAPWRMDYIEQLDAQDKPQTESQPACFLCEAAAVQNDSDEAARRLVLLRDERGVLLLNRYPYTNGHLLVAPHDHVGDLIDLDAPQRANLMELAVLGEKTIQAAMNPQGINIGMNIGRCAGAGVPGHIHIHILPRWNGDTNFMQTVGNVRVIPQAIEKSYESLKKALTKIL